MAGKKGRSGPPMNMNAAKHGLQCWLMRRALPLQKQHVARLVKEYQEGLVACKGGEAEVTEVEAALIQNAGRAFGACLLILEEAKARGLTMPVGKTTWDLSPGFAKLASFLNSERMALAVLGISRRSKDVTPNLSDLLQDAADGNGRPNR